ncbi:MULTISPECIES: sensor histidine kinase [Rheinheimera]|uniref:histidine kinase n=1 Tax=Rheinheimera marina TaxID=1774958 RepID=A0ABV9JKK3_9GAMM
MARPLHCRLARLVNDLLTFNKATLADSPLHLVQVSLNGLLEQALQANQGYASQYGVSFDWHPGQDLQMTVDPDKIMQVMSNLLSNAAKYSPQGGAVQIRSQQQGDKVRIEVEDSGPGIPLEFQDRVFEKFAQADSSNTRRVGGTGLGMAISKSLVELHGGSISFVSVPGKGTTFVFELPLLPVTPQDLN